MQSKVIATAEAYVNAHARNGNLHKQCLFWARGTVLGIEAHMGVRAIIQAGTLQWPFLRADLDDGERATHFSYQWCGSFEAALPTILDGSMPEMHCWAAIPDTGTLVDLTTKFIPRQFREMLPTETWTAIPPPELLWCHGSQLPPGVVYRPEPDAITAALLMLRIATGE